MFRQHVLDTLTHYSVDDEKKPTTLAELRARRKELELSQAAVESLTAEGQEEARLKGADEFESIKRNLPRLLHTEKHDTAVSALESYIKSFPRSVDAYFYLASIYEHAGAHDRALDTVHIARYLDPDSQRINKKLQTIENKALGQHRASLESKVLCYTSSVTFSRWNRAESLKELDSIIQNDDLRQTALDYLLLSPLSSETTIDQVTKFYGEAQADATDGVTSSSKLYRIESLFPFICVATKAIDAGTVVMNNTPFAIAPFMDVDNPKLLPTCFHCLKERPVVDRGFACPLFPQSCPFVFCSPMCVIRNVNVHRQECRFITSIVFPLAKETGFSPAFVLLVLRTLCRGFLERSLRPANAEGLQDFFRLHSFTSDYKTQRPWIWNSIKSLTRALCLYLPLDFRLHMEFEELSELVAIIHSNAIPVSYEAPAACVQGGDGRASLGLALCYDVCSLSHSCIPTCACTYTPQGSMVVRTLKNIPENGTLSISLVEDLSLPTSKRKNLESSWKVLICSCQRCREFSEGNRHPRGQICPICVRGIRNPLPYPILREILHRQIELHPKSHLTNDQSEKESGPTSNSRWFCNICGYLSPLECARCDSLETEINQSVHEAKAVWAVGKHLQSRQMLDEVAQRVNTLLHSNHYLLYNIHVFLAGLWNSGAGKNTNKALVYLRRAIISANSLFPPYHSEKSHLYSLYADLSLQLSGVKKFHARGLSQIKSTLEMDSEHAKLLSSDTLLSPMEAQWIAVTNSWMTQGPQSALWIAALQRLRTLALFCACHTPPILYEPKIKDAERIVDAVRRLLRNPGLTAKEIADVVNNDHHLIIQAACAAGDLTTLQCLSSIASYARREFETPNLSSGLNALGQAAWFGQIDVIRYLLDILHVDLFASNEWKMTALLAMASKPIGSLNVDATLGKKEDSVQALICRVLVEKATALEQLRIQQMEKMRLHVRSEVQAGNFPFLRRRLLEARSHALLGGNSAAHYAAAKDKPRLIWQIIMGGLNVDARNDESATCLHIASISGSQKVIRELVNLGSDLNAKNYRGETPLMHACFGLHPEIVSDFLGTNLVRLEVTAKHSSMNCLHAVVLGLTKTHSMGYLYSNRKRSDTIAASLGGFNPLALGVTYDTRTTSKSPPVTYLSMPVAEKESSDYSLFPKMLQQRLDRAEAIVKKLVPVCAASMLAHQSAYGFTASSLLQHRTDYLIQAFQSSLSEGDIRFSAASRQSKANMQQAWRCIFNRLESLSSYLAPTTIALSQKKLGVLKECFNQPGSENTPDAPVSLVGMAT